MTVAFVVFPGLEDDGEGYFPPQIVVFDVPRVRVRNSCKLGRRHFFKRVRLGLQNAFDSEVGLSQHVEVVLNRFLPTIEFGYAVLSPLFPAVFFSVKIVTYGPSSSSSITYRSTRADYGMGYCKNKKPVFS